VSTKIAISSTPQINFPVQGQNKAITGAFFYSACFAIFLLMPAFSLVSGLMAGIFMLLPKKLSSI